MVDSHSTGPVLHIFGVSIEATWISFWTTNWIARDLRYHSAHMNQYNVIQNPYNKQLQSRIQKMEVLVSVINQSEANVKTVTVSIWIYILCGVELGYHYLSFPFVNRPHSNRKTIFQIYDSQVKKDKTIARYCLYNGDLFPGKMVSLYWDNPLHFAYTAYIGCVYHL